MSNSLKAIIPQATIATGVAGKRQAGSLVGLDLLRLVAMGLVAVQHATSIAGWNPTPLLGNCDVGQLGVAIFCGLSGLLVLRSREHGQLDWLRRRLRKLYPPYWLALSAVLAVNCVVGYKPISFGLVLAQYAGIGFLTHGHALVGVHFWFVSLILLCYTISLLIRHEPRFTLALVAILAVGLPFEPWPWWHMLSFFSGAALAQVSKIPWIMALVPVYGLASHLVDPTYAYPFVATGMVAGAMLSPWRSQYWIARAAGLTYEFFLLHGPVYLILARLTGFDLLANLFVGSLVSIAAAICLQWTAQRLLRLGGRLDQGGRALAISGLNVVNR